MLRCMSKKIQYVRVRVCAFLCVCISNACMSKRECLLKCLSKKKNMYVCVWCVSVTCVCQRESV